MKSKSKNASGKKDKLRKKNFKSKTMRKTKKTSAAKKFTSAKVKSSRSMNKAKKHVSFNESLNSSEIFAKNSILAPSRKADKPTVDQDLSSSQHSVVKKAKNFRTSQKLNDKLAVMSRKDRKAYLSKLKSAKKPNYELSRKVKLLWEKLRSKKVTLAEKNQLTDELYSLVEGRAKKLIFAHDTVRVLQCLMALKNAHVTAKLFEELKDDVLEMTQNKYSKFFVVKMLKYGTPAQRSHILKSFFGKIVDLMKHNIACDVVEYLYNDYAQALERSQICSEFYSNEYQVFKLQETVYLDEILKRHPEKKDGIKKHMLEVIISLANKPALRHSLAHKICALFLQNFGDDESSRSEIIDSLKERIPELVHTKDGVFCSMFCVWYGSVKERKVIVKSLKNLAVKICFEEHGHQLLTAIFDSVDDTITVSKFIIQEMISNLEQILKNPYGTRVVLYLLCPRDPKHFNKEQIKLFSTGDNNTISKKPLVAKHQALLSEISPSLIQHAAENCRAMIFGSSKFPLLFEYIASFAAGDKSEIYEQLNEILTEEFVPCNVENMHIVEHVRGHTILKSLLKNDKKLNVSGQATFAEYLVDHVSLDQLSSWLSCNKGAFVLVAMHETGIERVQKVVSECIQRNVNRLKKYSFKGAEVLLRKLKET